MTRSICMVLLLLAASLMAQNGESLAEARQGHVTKLLKTRKTGGAFPAQVPEGFQLVTYDGDFGPMKALLARPRTKAKKLPAMVWVAGGIPPGGAHSSAWEPQDPDNDQSAKVYRRNGLMMLYPSFRGSFGNSGAFESFYGEVDDVIAAGRYLKSRDDVDPDRIYLGGHSTGGTLVLLAAESTTLFRSVFAFGPVPRFTDYSAQAMVFDVKDAKECRLRAPVEFLDGIKVPTWIIEGVFGTGNGVEAFEYRNRNPLVTVAPITMADHFSVLAPVNEMLAERLAKLKKKQQLSLTAAELDAGVASWRARHREVWDLRQLAALRSRGLSFKKKQRVSWYFTASARKNLQSALNEAGAARYKTSDITEHKEADGEVWYSASVFKRQNLLSLSTMFRASAFMEALKYRHEVYYQGWDVEH